MKKRPGSPGLFCFAFVLLYVATKAERVSAAAARRKVTIRARSYAEANALLEGGTENCEFSFRGSPKSVRNSQGQSINMIEISSAATI